MGTQGKGIVNVPLESRPTPHSVSDATTPGEAILRLADLEGELYAVSESAIYRYDAAPKHWQRVLTAGAAVISDRNVAALALSAGRLWIGYFDRGLDVVGAGLEQAVHHEGDTLFCINRIVEDTAGARTAVATANGLVSPIRPASRLESN